MTSEILVRRNAKGVDAESAGRSTVVGIDASFISAGCHGIDDLAQCLIDAHVGGDLSAHKRLLRRRYKMINNSPRETGGLFNDVYRMVIRTANRNHWKIEENGRLERLTELAIDNAIQKPVCKACDGTKFINAKPCNDCAGSGIRRDNQRYMAKQLDMSQSTYQRSWQYRFAEIVAMLQIIRDEANNRVSRQVFCE